MAVKKLPTIKARRSNADISADTKAAILVATIASLAESGYAGTTLSGIAQRVGVSRAALLYHFDCKHTLMTAVINQIYDEMSALYRAAAHASLTRQEQLIAVLDASFKLTSSVSQMAQIELLLAARRDPEFRLMVAPTIAARDRAFEQAWHDMTQGTRGGAERLDLIRDFSVSVFRGMTVNRSLAASSPSFDRQLLILRKLLLDAL